MFKVTDTHYAKTWLLHPDAPKVEKPEGIQNIHEKLVKAFNIQEIQIVSKLNRNTENQEHASHLPEHGPIDENGKEVLLSLKNVDITF